MYQNQYKLLTASWKAHFDFFSLKKIDHKDLSPFKLQYNKELFELLYKDQKQRHCRGKNKYEELAERIFNDVEREHFVRNKTGISLESLLGVVQESEIITGVHMKEQGEYQYPILMIKCFASTLTLNKDEVTFLSTALPCHYDDQSGSITIAIASIPFLNKKTLKNEERLFKWAIRIAEENIEKYYEKVFDKKPRKKTLPEKIKNKLEDVQIKYFL
jgi:hypothetical protein